MFYFYTDFKGDRVYLQFTLTKVVIYGYVTLVFKGYYEVQAKSRYQ
jgi:hypothetical protein